jgi:hypothetical protein
VERFTSVVAVPKAGARADDASLERVEVPHLQCSQAILPGEELRRSAQLLGITGHNGRTVEMNDVSRYLSLRAAFHLGRLHLDNVSLEAAAQVGRDMGEI